MIWPVVWLPEATEELQAARERYDSLRVGLGQRFADAVAETVESIARSPLQYAIVKKDRRRAGVRWFPYGIYFVVEESRVLVMACFHGKRHPKHWQAR